MKTMTEQKALNKKKLEEILKNIPYEDYYSDNKAAGGIPRCGKSVLDELRQKSLNCSDKAPHQEEIDYLTKMGLKPKQIAQILQISYGIQDYVKIKQELNRK